MKASVLIALLTFLHCGCKPTERKETAIPMRKEDAPRLPVGYSVPVHEITEAKLAYAKSVGIDHIEVSGMKVFVDENRKFLLSDSEMTEALRNAKNAAMMAGITIWSIHMPYGPNIDLSMREEEERKKVVAVHEKLLRFLEILEPEIILFHPSYYLGLNERELRKSQLIKSAMELNQSVRAINATMVIENMLGYELMRDEHRERPLCRTVEETIEIMNELPASIYSAIDMNHIIRPERLIRAMGSRLRTVHIADGTGKHENHFFPCSGQGQNDWVAILTALHEVGYNGPFLFESAYRDEKDLVECYNTLFAGLSEKISVSDD